MPKDIVKMTAKTAGSKDELLREYELSWIERIAGKVLEHGGVPKHLAVIMDGNRRYARQRKQKVIEGHSKGFSKLSELLFWCRQIGISEVTVYAFSIENFKRSEEEVNGLMKLAEDKIRELIDSAEKLKEEGLCIRIIGNLTYLPMSLQKACAEIVLLTKNYNRYFLNIALSYTSRDEMCSAINDLVEGANQGVIGTNDFNEEAMSKAMYSISPDPDLLIRTSGEVRLSDFMLWQTGFTVVEFVPALWPELNIWQFYGAILNYQWQARNIRNSLTVTELPNKWNIEDEKIAQFRKFVEDRRMTRLVQVSEGAINGQTVTNAQTRISES